MKAEYYAETDMLSITLSRTPYEVGTGEDTHDDDVTLLYDTEGRLAEIEVSRASERVDLDEMRRKLSFEEVRSTKPVA